MFSACVPRELETVQIKKNPGGKEDSPQQPKTFKDEVEENLGGHPTKFYPASVPIKEIWQNINYSGFDWEKLKNLCPQISGLACDYGTKTQTIKFKTRKDGEKTIVEIADISHRKYGISYYNEEIVFEGKSLAAVWEISGGGNNFSIIKWEKIGNQDGDEKYGRIEIYFSSENGVKKISASGTIGSNRESYHFSAESLLFSACENTPRGEMLIQGENSVTAYFDANDPAIQYKECNDCTPVKFDNQYKFETFCYKGPWTLRDLFDYLDSYIQ